MRLIYFCCTFSLLLLTHRLAAQVTNLGNFNTGNYNSFYPFFKAKIGNRLFFTAPFDKANGRDVFSFDLWMTDATAAGTKALNIRGMYYENLESNDSLLFYSTSKNLDNGLMNLWQLDGRNLVQTQLFEGYNISYPVIKKETLFFTARDVTTPTKSYLYSYNFNTQTLNKISPSTQFGRKSDSYYQTINSYAFNDKLLLYWAYVVSSSTFTGYELWRTDGTANGTYRLDTTRTSQLNLHAFKDKFYFNQTEPTSFGEYAVNAWETDGTAKPTKLTLDLNFAAGLWTEKGFTGLGQDSTHGADVWFSDFSKNGTINIGDLDSTRYTYYLNGQYIPLKAGCYPRGFTKLNDKIYFFSRNDSCSLAFYETDGSRSGTKLVKPIVNKKDATYEENSRKTFQANGKIYAEILTPQYGNEIFVSDGTPQGTTILDVWKGGGNSQYWEGLRSFDFTDKNAYFVANNGISGAQIWQSDGVNNALKRVSNNVLKRRNSGTYTLGGFNNQLLFTTQTDTILSFWRVDEAQPTTLKDELIPKNYKWLTSFGNIGFDNSYIQLLSLTTDAQHNTCVIGKYSYRGLAFFDTTQPLVRNRKNIKSNYNDNLFIAKFDSMGKVLWSKDLFSVSIWDARKMMSVDEVGNIYVVAQNNSIALPNDVFVDNTLVHSGVGRSLFILKFDPNGKLLWFKKTFASSFLTADFQSITVKDKNVYVMGKTATDLFLDNVKIPTGLFALKLNETGKTAWATTLDKNVKLETVRLAIDGEGNLITSDSEGHLSKLKSDNGDILWTKTLPLSKTAKLTTQNDGTIGLLTDFIGTITFDSKTVTTSAAGLAWVKLNADGDVIQATVLDNAAAIRPLDIVTDEKNVFKVMYFKVKAENSPVLTSPNWDIYSRRSLVVKQFTATGLQLAQREIFTLGDENDVMASFDKNDDFVFAGHDVQYVDTIPNIPLSPRGYYVLARFSLRGRAVEPKDEVLTLSDVSLSPNPASNTLVLSSKDGDFTDANILIYNILGQIQTVVTTHSDSGIKTIDVSHLDKGIYILIIQRGDKRLTTKFSKF
jgi:ELWxxDGT repeat protein